MRKMVIGTIRCLNQFT